MAINDFLIDLNRVIAKRYNLNVEASWAYASNITAHNEKQRNTASADFAKFMKEVSKDINKFNWRSFHSKDMRRQFRMLSELGYAALPETEFNELMDILSAMETNFAKVRVCDYQNHEKCNLALEPEIEEIMSHSRDPRALEYYWLQFYNAAGTPTRKWFERYIELNTLAAKLNSESLSSLWSFLFESCYL